ncbi:MAG: DUF4296 domain-containing protein [Salinivirgaceae bacterium]|jgi:hypothetical protein
MRIWLISILLLGTISCSNSESNQKIIDKNTMIEVLVDIHIADATLSIANLKINRDTNEIELYYGDVLKKHHITQNQIDNSLKYYTSRPKEFEKIYEKVSEKLAKMESEFQQNQAKDDDLVKGDSIKNDTLLME